MRLENTVKTFISRHNLIKRGDKIIVAVSGGPDSMCLLHLLNRLKYDLGLRLHVAHINHQLRKSARRDALFVERCARQLCLPVSVFCVKIQKRKRISSIEERAREARIDCLVRCARINKASAVALGHNKDDLGETVLMRLLRGTGMAGLRAIWPKRKINNTLFIRPLIELRRQDIISFLKREGIPSRTDPTNKQTRFYRNKIRKQLLPILRQDYNKNIVEALFSLSQTISIDYDFLETESQKILKKIIRKAGSQTLKLSLAKLRTNHPALQRMVIRLCLERLLGNTRKITFSHMREIEDLIEHRPDGSAVHLPREINVSKAHSFLWFTLRNS